MERLGETAFVQKYLPYAWESREMFVEATLESIYMIFWTCIIAGFFGIIVGVIATLTEEGGILENKPVYKIIDQAINIFRSIPFVILIALLSGLTRKIIGTSIGAKAALVPLIFGTVPFYGRQVQIALSEVNPGVVEAAQAMGQSPLDIVFRVYLREGLPAILRVSASTVINVIGLTAMAGVVGGGGLGTMAIARGYQRSRMDIIIVSTLLILLLVWISQTIFNWLIKKVEH